MLSPFKKILISWILAVAAGSLISQFPPPSIPLVYAIWCVLIAAASVGTAKAFNLKDEKQKGLWFFWVVLCLAVFIENVLAYFVPQLQFLLQFNFFFVWSVAMGFGYIYTAEKANWKELKMLGYLSVLSSILFFFPPLLPHQPLIFGIVQVGLLGYLLFH